ncbi:MAG: S9 family peptidase [SAR86 cluster bacterium]|uniref:S9 family peptidase n=1 Tax=SAR86 cluster bacterium TaxID=2030880 RepID=A0A2A5ATV4_9GAMM|nr:MAG: S9 family peptidase [SAR86 cluster bacterium]
MYSDSVAEPVTLADYQRAEKFLAANTGKLIDGNILAQYWQDDDRLVYKRSTVGGSQYVVVDVVADVANEGKILLFDADRLLSALASFTEEELDAKNLDLSNLQLNATDNQLDFSFDGSDYSLNLNTYGLKQLEEAPSDEFLSPDNSKAAFIDGYNLWLRDTASNELTQLTFDGEENYGYATNNAGWLRDDGPVLLWSPDSQKIATFRHDGRNVGEMYLYSTQVGHVELDAWKYPLPGDDFIFMIERLVIHLGESSKIVKLNMPPDPHRSTTSDHIAGRGGIFLDVEWSADSESLSFVSSSRDHKVAQLRVADPENGEVRDVFTETTETYYESGSISANWRVLGARNEFLWYSEQDNWGHLYLHDLQTGKQKLQLTSGSWRVTRVYKVDLDNEQVYFTGSNRETGDPYYQYLYRINLDGTGLVNLTPEIANHVISWSDSENYFSDVFSTPTEAAQSVIRNTSGKEVLELETVDISALLADGWVAPEPFIVKSRDQITDIYGLLYKPSNFNPDKSYPVLNYLYPGPQSGSVGSRSFRASRNDKQALAELGFIVVELDAMGTPGRSKSFHDIYYGNMGDNGLPDQITGIRQLAAENSWMDLDRVGIWGHSGGGYASTAGIFRYPEFYKVAVSGAGNHDNRNYEDDWGEKWQGLLETYPESNPLDSDSEEDSPAATNYDNQANQLLAENLQGKLLLAHGMLDTNVHPSSTLLVVQALIDAEKDFDLVVLPNSSHGFGNRRYFMKRRWDYFVEHLAGSEPSTDFKFADNIR